MHKNAKMPAKSEYKCIKWWTREGIDASVKASGCRPRANQGSRPNSRIKKIKTPRRAFHFFGGHERARTSDLYHVKVAL